MLKVLTCLTVDHDLRLVAVAAAICAIGSLVAMRLFMRARASDGILRRQWLVMAGTAAGTATWTTHFLAMLAFAPDLSTGYDPFLTTISLLIAVVGMTLAFIVAGWSSTGFHPWLGGALAGLSISAMHYIGMAGFRVAGTVQWETGYVAASVTASIALGMVAIHLTRWPDTIRGRYGAAVAFVLAICSLHFTGMAAVTILPDPLVEVPLGAVPKQVMVLFIAAASALVLAIGIAAYFADKSARGEGQARLRRLANAAIEGLIIVKENRIVDVNTSFEELTGCKRDQIVGKSLFDNFLTVEGGVAPPAGALKSEGVLRGEGGRLIPVEVLSKPADILAGGRVYSVRDLTEQKTAEGRIHYLAHFDALTGLPNRSSFLERLAAEISEAQEKNESFALLSFDLDRFKEANDMLGHAAGDLVLNDIARRFKAALNTSEYAARFGGDEFFAILPDAGSPQQVVAFAERILAHLRAPMTIEGNELFIGASVGIALFPADARTAPELMANADLALYRAKDRADGRACFFESDMDFEVRERRNLTRDLRLALAQGQFELYYQPQSRLTDNRTVGYEALIRWHHPQRGLVSPAGFIPIAEETGLIVQIGEWVLREACATAASWAEPYRIAVNLSPVQFSQGGLTETVHAVLVATGLSPKRLELEVTESLLMSDPDMALHTLRRLKALGVSVAMDDFGTGYSSLSTLQSFPFDKIKIDRSFLDKLGKHHKSASIIRAVLALGRSLEIPVLAEGIETKAHLDFLKDEGCDEAQGYFLGRPMPQAMMFPETSAHPGEVESLRRKGFAPS
ncbi:EAL domain-containing protein [Nordella sp. HKS 07]|uniref:bifunctional diguanylate cyclase/phosphodiesterase n=1 Tax=Nordella sp. HKS 07 TaxID=2712222 RepID=UPI0013E11B22|nr:EAL domain-containing protein [Nordella sp. HKS 07]QIG47091.1 EAL domain-containing protein [Nordella sp. HKS 07]